MTQLNNQILNEWGLTIEGGAPFKVMAMDAALGTTPNAGLQQLFTTAIDPQYVEYLFAPTPLATVFDEVQRGTWADTNMTFGVIEGAGNPTTYGDWNEDSSTSVNAEFINRQSYTYQQILRVGDLEQDLYGQAMISMASEKQKWAADSLNRRQHQTYVLGVDGLENYGMLNDPNLSAAIQGSSWNGETLTVYKDFQKLFAQLVGQTEGLVDENSELVLLVPPKAKTAFLNTNDYGLTPLAVLKTTYPNLKLVSIPQYSTDSGDYMQLACSHYNGSANIQLAYNTKMRVHNIVLGHSGFSQKRTQGSYGAIIKRPTFVATMILQA